MLFALISVLIVICSILLILVILVQNPKGGGLSSAFGGGAQQMMGVQKTTDFLDKATWTLAAAIAALALISNFTIDRADVSGTPDSQIELNTGGPGMVPNQAPQGQDGNIVTEIPEVEDVPAESEPEGESESE